MRTVRAKIIGAAVTLGAAATAAAIVLSETGAHLAASGAGQIFYHM